MQNTEISCHNFTHPVDRQPQAGGVADAHDGMHPQILQRIDAELLLAVAAWDGDYTEVALGRKRSDLLERVSAGNGVVRAAPSGIHAWPWRLLAQSPDLQESVREEVLQRLPTDRSPVWDNVSDLAQTRTVLATCGTETADVDTVAVRCLIVARVLARYELGQPGRSLSLLSVNDGLVGSSADADGIIQLRPLERTVFLTGVAAGEHALLDRCFRLRREVFVERLGWPLKVDGLGREIDQFDHNTTGYFAVLREGDVVATARVLPGHAPTLLYNVFSHLIADETAKVPPPNIWEGARLAVCLSYSAGKRSSVCARLLADAIRAAMQQGITHIYTVSDPVMEKILLRTGARPSRLGPVVVDEYGIPALALKVVCDEETESSCRKAEVHLARIGMQVRTAAA